MTPTGMIFSRYAIILLSLVTKRTRHWDAPASTSTVFLQPPEPLARSGMISHHVATATTNRFVPAAFQYSMRAVTSFAYTGTSTKLFLTSRTEQIGRAH